MYDLIVIGAGPAGYVGAIRAAQLGLKTALVERDLVGGTCLNRGCIPTKALMHCADLYAEITELGSFGISVTQPAFDFSAMHDYKNASVESLRKGVEQLVAGNGIELIYGSAVITSPNTVNICGNDYTAKHIMIATGSRPAIPPITGSELAGVYSSDGILEGHGVDTKRLVIVGGGVIGAEIAQIYSELGCKVTIVEALDRILPMMDREISQNLSMIFKKRGIDVFASAKVEAIESAEPLRVVFTQRNAQKSVDCDSVLICTGRRPNVESIAGEDLELATNGRFLAVNERYETSVPSILAVGDCNGRLQLAHAAEAQAICAVEMLAGIEPSIKADIVPSCVYTKPEIACTGITADEAKARGIAVRTGKYVMGGNAKTIIEKAERSFIKLVFDAESDVLLGAQLMCNRATDMITELNLALANGLTSRELMLSLRPHPSFAEAVTEAVETSHGASIHTMPPKTRR